MRPDSGGRAAVLGRPIAHSLSPVLHRAAYAALGLTWTYEAIDCGEDELAGVLAARAGWAGFSCTMPLKRAAVACAASVGATAAAVGAANTLLPRSGGWHAENTDVAGIVGALGPCAGTATILGAGGTAQAAVVALAELGLRRCTVLVRDARRTSEVIAAADAVRMGVVIGTLHPQTTALDADVVISTLPRGAADPFALRAWQLQQTVLDAVYDPWPTALAASVAAAGATVRSGALMLLHQAAAQVELMTGRPAPVEAMRAALRVAAPSAGV